MRRGKNACNVGCRIVDGGFQIRDPTHPPKDNTGSSMDKEDLKQRTRQFGLRVIRLTEALPHKRAADVIGKQLLRSATSVGANYRAACRARSKADFISKIGVVEEEADESVYWLELIVEAELLPKSRVNDLLQEANELTAIFTATGRSAKANRS